MKKTEILMPEHLMTKQYLDNKAKTIIKYVNGEDDIKDLSNDVLFKILFSTEQISQAIRQIISSRGIYYSDYGYEKTDFLPVVKYEDGILEIIIPPSVKRPSNESWYLASMVRQGLEKLNEPLNIEGPYFLICERIVPNGQTVMQDNDNLEVHRIINECMSFLGSTDHPLKVGYASVARIEKGNHYSRILLMNERDCSQYFLQVL